MESGDHMCSIVFVSEEDLPVGQANTHLTIHFIDSEKLLIGHVSLY